MTTTIANFTPRWTGTSNLGSFTEGDQVSYQSTTQNVSRNVVLAAGFALDCGVYCAGIVSVTINGVAAAYSVAGTTISFAPIATSSAIVEIISSTPNAFSLLCGGLPPGLELSSSGLLSGTLGVIIPAPGVAELLFSFVLRAANPSGDVADMAFTISGTRAVVTDTFNTAILPDPLVDSFLNMPYIPLGSYQPSQSVAYTIDVITTDGTPATMALDNSFYMGENGYMEFAGPPPGVVISGTEIVGQIAADAMSGLYLFHAVVDGTSLSAYFGIEVIPYAGIAYSPPVTLQWVSQPDLGTLPEGTACYLSVLADAYATTAPVVYSTVARLSSMPPGLSLSPSGELTGELAYGLSNATFSFTIRATTGTTFVDQMFSLTAASKFNAPTIYDIGFNLERTQAAAFAAPYASLIPVASLFRAEDHNFGMAEPRIYLFNGIDGSIDLTSVLAAEPEPAITNDSYFSPIRFLLGEHLSAPVSDSFGSAVYEVVYRKLYEFDPDAGGFTTGNSPTTSLVLYPQSRVAGGIYVYTVCARNMRCKLLTAFGGATSSAISQTFGPAGGENPPLWMGGQFILALPIAYVLPGNGASIAATLNASSAVAPNGFEYTFDSLNCVGGVTESLQF